MMMQHYTNSFFLCSEGSNSTPAHRYSDFRFKTYAPMAFRYFRALFGIAPDDFMVRNYINLFIPGLFYCV